MCVVCACACATGIVQHGFESNSVHTSRFWRFVFLYELCFPLLFFFPLAPFEMSSLAPTMTQNILLFAGFPFEVSLSNGRTLVLVASDSIDRQDWVYIIELAQLERLSALATAKVADLQHVYTLCSLESACVGTRASQGTEQAAHAYKQK